MKISRRTVSRVFVSLVEKGYIERISVKGDKRLKKIDNEYLVSYVNMKKYSTILFVMAKIMEMNYTEQNQVAMYLINAI